MERGSLCTVQFTSTKNLIFEGGYLVQTGERYAKTHVFRFRQSQVDMHVVTWQAYECEMCVR